MKFFDFFKPKPEPRCEYCGGEMYPGYVGRHIIVDPMCKTPHSPLETHPWLFKNDSVKEGN
jgi:hypothetical protein